MEPYCACTNKHSPWKSLSRQQGTIEWTWASTSHAIILQNVQSIRSVITPDSNSRVFWFSLEKSKTVLKIKENATWQLMVILKIEFTDCLEKYNRRRDKCVSFQGDYQGAIGPTCTFSPSILNGWKLSVSGHAGFEHCSEMSWINFHHLWR